MVLEMVTEVKKKKVGEKAEDGRIRRSTKQQGNKKRGEEALNAKGKNSIFKM